MLILMGRIGDDILVKVVGVNGNQVRIGIEAPLDVQVVRTELLAKAESEPDHPPD